MWDKIKQFIFLSERAPESIPDIPFHEETVPSPSPEGSTAFYDKAKIFTDALAHYCVDCDRGFKTRGARNAHIKLKHGKQNQ